MLKKIILAMIILRVILFTLCYIIKLKKDYKNATSNKMVRFHKINYLIECFYQVLFLSEATLFIALVAKVSEKLVDTLEFLMRIVEKLSYKTYDLFFSGDDE